MLTFWVDLLGLHEKAETIAVSQVCWRTLSVFLLAIILLRISGRRTFASNSAVDMVVKFMTGALLSQAILASVPYWLGIVGATTLILLHRVVAYGTYFFPALGRLLHGSPSVLAEGSVINHHELRRASITEDDMLASVRANANIDDLAQAKTVRLEHDGVVSIVKKEA